MKETEAAVATASSQTTPFAFGPRLGIAYQIAPKTVFRVGAGVAYYKTDDDQVGFSTGSEYLYATSAYGTPAFNLQNGMPYKLTFPNFYAGQYLFPGSLGSAPRKWTRTPRQTRSSGAMGIGLQHEIFPICLWKRLMSCSRRIGMPVTSSTPMPSRNRILKPMV